jgi:uncharacterized protein YndB with AHSA1/START domain
MTDATVDTSGPRPAIRFERQVPQPPDVVWRALTDPEELRSWFPCEIVAKEWKVGAPLTFLFREHDVPALTGTVLELDEPRLLAYTWGDETLRFELTPHASGGTILVLSDELAPGIAARNAAGWEICLERLAGQQPADGAWRPLFVRYAAAFESTLGPQEGPPPGFDDESP